MLFASIVAGTENLSDRKSKVFQTPACALLACHSPWVTDGYVRTQTTTAGAAVSTLASVSRITIKEVQVLYFWPCSRRVSNSV